MSHVHTEGSLFPTERTDLVLAPLASQIFRPSPGAVPESGSSGRVGRRRGPCSFFICVMLPIRFELYMNLLRTYAYSALVRSCVGATRRRSRAIPPAAPTLGRDRPNSPFGVRARRRGWASALRAGERASPMTSPAAARPECPSARPASRPPRLALDRALAYGRESPARSHGNPIRIGRALSGSSSAEPPEPGVGRALAPRRCAPRRSDAPPPALRAGLRKKRHAATAR
jgi:hypothetical protein